MGFKTFARGRLLLAALALVAGGVAWSVYQDHEREFEGEGVPTSGYVVSVRRDSLGCETPLPFGAKDCRYVVKIRHRPRGAPVEQDFLQAVTYRYLPGPKIAGGDPVTGICSFRGRCRFRELEEKPWGLYLGLLALAVCTTGLLHRRRTL